MKPQSTPAPRLQTNFTQAVLGNGLFQLCRFGVVVVLARLTSAEFVGRYDFAATALAAPVVLFCGLETRHAYVADARGELPFSAYRAVRRLGMIVAALLLLGAAAWYEPDLSGPFFWLMVGVSAARIVYQLAEVDWGLFQRRERIDWLGAANGIRGLWLIGIFAVFVPAAHFLAPPADRPQAVAWAASAAALCVTAVWWAVWRWYDLPRLAGPELRQPWNWSQARAVAWQALPLGVVILLINLCDSVPRWIMVESAGLEPLGYFGAIKYISMAASFIVIQLGTAAGNRLATAYQTDGRAFLRLAARLTGVTLALAVGLVVAGLAFAEPFLRVTLAEEYARYAPEFVILLAGQAILMLGSLFGFVTTHMRRFWIQVPIQLAILAATSLAAWAWIPADPVGGAAWTTVVRAITQASLYFACVWIGLATAGRGAGGTAGEGSGPSEKSTTQVDLTRVD